MNIDLFGGNWYVARAVLMLATFALFALFVTLVHLVQKRSERRGRGDAPRGVGATPEPWGAAGPTRDPPIERRAA
jgi:hypothetical protein